MTANKGFLAGLSLICLLFKMLSVTGTLKTNFTQSYGSQKFIKEMKWSLVWSCAKGKFWKGAINPLSSQEAFKSFFQAEELVIPAKIKLIWRLYNISK